MVVVSQTLLTQNLRKLAWGLNSFFVGVEKNLCWVALKAMSILRTSLQRIIWRWEGGRDRGSTVHCTVQFSRNINSGHCLECHNGSHSENRDKATYDLNRLESQVDRKWWGIQIFMTNVSESIGKDIPILLCWGPYSKVEITIVHTKNSSTQLFLV